MARPTVIDDDTLLEAARSVFLERGFKATTSEVAAKAGVSEGSLFRRYKSKDVLFHTALSDAASVDELEQFLPTILGRGEMKEQLFSIAIQGAEKMRVVVPMVMMTWSHPGGDDVAAQLAIPNPPQIRALRALASYFSAEMQLGRLRLRDPEIVARTFMGAVWNFAMMEICFKSQDLLPMSKEVFARGFVEMQWAALDPSSDR